MDGQAGTAVSEVIGGHAIEASVLDRDVADCDRRFEGQGGVVTTASMADGDVLKDAVSGDIASDVEPPPTSRLRALAAELDRLVGGPLGEQRRRLVAPPELEFGADCKNNRRAGEDPQSGAIVHPNAAGDLDGALPGCICSDRSGNF